MADNDLVTIGETIALMPEASTANDPSELLDGQSGDNNFPFARFKPLATVGEVDPVTGDALTGYPDGNAAFLKDDDTITVVYQSESYGLMSKQTYGWEMASGVSFTGSHIHTIDYDREKFAEFLETGDSAADMFLESGHLFDTIYNVFGEVVDGKNDDATDLSAKWGNQTLPTGELVDFSQPLTEGDFFFQSFCGAFLETANKYGDGIGFEDNVWLTAEEWNIQYIFPNGATTSNATMGLASIAVDVRIQSQPWVKLVMKNCCP
ncbi:MAG: hypothetical protein EBT20_08280 [Alphaproteobacteria bacterium]|nr:hypothetical protein [Alphaproteobacteria bacterium]